MSMTRREVLESSMWATASAAALSLTPRALAAEPKRGANEVLRIAVVGLRGRGGRHLAEFGGLKDVQIESSAERAVFRSGQEFWDWVLYGNPLPGMLVAKGE